MDSLAGNDAFAADEDAHNVSSTMMWFRGVCLALVVVAVSSVLQRRNDTNSKLGSLDSSTGANTTKATETSESDNKVSTTTVPFLVVEEPTWRDLSVMMEKYRQDSSNLLRGISQSLEVALHSEREMGIEPQIQVAEADEPSSKNNGNANADSQQSFLFSTRLRYRVEKLSACLDHNENELVKLIQEFPVRFALPHEQDIILSNRNDDGNKYDNNRNQQQSTTTTHIFTMPHAFGFNANMGADSNKKNAYDCGAQLIAHIVRDWTFLGEGVRASIYDWCRSMVELHYRASDATSSEPLLPILVPGAGLGRLAHDLAFLSGYSVEANEVSLSMIAAAHSILQDKKSGSIYPFALDFFANEVESERHYDRVDYPDTTIENNTANGSLSFTHGDFVKIFRWQRPRASFGCVVTCFFIDTATNVYEYLSTIEHALSSGGIWINIGPLRWHHNSVLHPAADELRNMIESSVYGFEVLEWNVDERPSEYRHEDNEYVGDGGGKPFVRYTSYEGYRPLRFVVRRK